MDNLEYIALQLAELIKMAKANGDEFLVYLLEMALAETYDEITTLRYDKGV